MFGNYKNWVIFRPIIDIYNSFFNKTGGFSYRKLAATFALIAAYHLSNQIKDENIKLQVIFYWQTFAATCIGLVSATKVISLFTNKKEENNDKAI